VGRRLGQHFLNRPSVLNRIADAACPIREPLVIEIGAGAGALTGPLLERADRVVAIETDPEMVSRLRQRCATSSLTVLHGDVLEVDLTQWGPAVVAGNLPYYITSPILKRVLTLGPLLKSAVFLVQREVAERLTAVPGSRDYGFLSVLTSFYSEPEYLFTVPPSAFRPPPKVDSAVVRLSPRPVEAWRVADPSAFLEFAGLCFRQKRKTIRNNLVAVYGKAVVDNLPEAGLRAEQLSIPQFATLYDRLCAQR